MATRDEGSRTARHDDQVQGLTTQISFLEEEVAVLRRRLSDAPRHVRLLEERLRESEASLAAVTSQNERLADTLREARDQIVALKEEVDRLAQPPSGFGVFLEACEDGTADVFTGGRKMRVSVSPAVELDSLRPGQEVVLNEALNVVIAQGYETVGEIVMLKEILEAATGRWSSRTPMRSAWSGWRSRCGTPRSGPATRCCSSRGPATCTSGFPRLRSKSSSWRKSRTSPIPTSAG